MNLGRTLPPPNLILTKTIRNDSQSWDGWLEKKSLSHGEVLTWVLMAVFITALFTFAV